MFSNWIVMMVAQLSKFILKISELYIKNRCLCTAFDVLPDSPTPLTWASFLSLVHVLALSCICLPASFTQMNLFSISSSTEEV